MTKVIAAFNAGSSSLKFSVFRYDNLALLHKDNIAVPDTEQGYKKALHIALDEFSRRGEEWQLHVAGHRVAHGKDYAGPMRLTPDLYAQLEALIPLAPLHQTHSLRIIDELSAHYPRLTQMACFDTSFHRTQSKGASVFALPRHFFDEGIKRYGFHGLSYEYIASELPAYAHDKAKGRVIVAHLGNGASMCAMRNLKSQATTMGFSALDGLMMGTRCGTLDAGVVLYMQQQLGMTVGDLQNILYHQSGLLGVSGISHDMRTLEQNPLLEAEEALNLFCYMAATQLGGLMTALGGLDVLVFTGGIGEHSSRIRRTICSYLMWAGLLVDEKANQSASVAIHPKDSAIDIYVIPTNEEIIVARACQKSIAVP